MREKKRDEIKSDCLFTFFFFFLFDGPVDGWIVFASYEFILSNFFSPPTACSDVQFCSKFKLTDPRRLVISKYFHLIRSRRRYLARSSFLSLTLRSARARFTRDYARFYARIFRHILCACTFFWRVDLHSPSTIVHKVLLPRQRVK